MQERKHTLVATLGGQPQIVTFALDLLLRRGTPIEEVIVVHPAASPDLQQSLQRLKAEFAGDRYLFEGHSLCMRFRQQVLSHHSVIIDDIVDETTASGALDTIGEMIRELKQQRHIIHFSITGGRRLMAFLSFSAALLYFESPDELLHLYTPEQAKVDSSTSDVMHVPAHYGQHLIKVPFASAAQPVLAWMLNHSSSATIQTYDEQRKAEEQKRCRQVVGALKGKALKVLQGLARGLHPNEVAAALCIKPSTISTYTNVIYQLCRNVWNVPENIQVNYLFVQARFSDYVFDE
jgi:CRISPR-associated protein Csx14